MQLAYKFNQQATTEYSDFKTDQGSLIEIKQRLLDGGKLTRAEKDRLQEQINHNSYSKRGIPVMGWMFDFSQFLNLYIVKQYGDTQEVYAFDKTAIRNTTYGAIEYIKELR